MLLLLCLIPFGQLAAAKSEPGNERIIHVERGGGVADSTLSGFIQVMVRPEPHGATWHIRASKITAVVVDRREVCLHVSLDERHLVFVINDRFQDSEDVMQVLREVLD